MLRFNFDMDMSAVSVPESDLIYDVLLGGYNSRLFIELSEKRGIFYDISGSSERYRNVGFFSFSFELKPADVTLAVESVLEVISELCEDLLSEDQCMKASYVDNGLMLYDDSRELNFTMAYDNHLLERGYSTLADRAEAYRKVTPERLREVANIIFRPENLTLTAKGNKRHFDTEKISELIKSFRSIKQ